eukprot:8667771-Pyramimonas_sp.AAC.1
MVSNILDVDEAMLATAAAGEGGMAFFFDFAAGVSVRGAPADIRFLPRPWLAVLARQLGADL